MLHQGCLCVLWTCKELFNMLRSVTVHQTWVLVGLRFQRTYLSCYQQWSQYQLCHLKVDLKSNSTLSKLEPCEVLQKRRSGDDIVIDFLSRLCEHEFRESRAHPGPCLVLPCLVQCCILGSVILLVCCTHFVLMWPHTLHKTETDTQTKPDPTEPAWFSASPKIQDQSCKAGHSIYKFINGFWYFLLIL